MLACRFVVIEDSGPAGQLSEVVLDEIARVVTILLRKLWVSLILDDGWTISVVDRHTRRWV
jgi:hypothetical protein